MPYGAGQEEGVRADWLIQTRPGDGGVDTVAPCSFTQDIGRMQTTVRGVLG